MQEIAVRLQDAVADRLTLGIRGCEPILGSRVVGLVGHVELRQDVIAGDDGVIVLVGIGVGVRSRVHRLRLLVMDARQHRVLAAPLVVRVVAGRRCGHGGLDEFLFQHDRPFALFAVGEDEGAAHAERVLLVALVAVAVAEVAGREIVARIAVDDAAVREGRHVDAQILRAVPHVVGGPDMPAPQDGLRRVADGDHGVALRQRLFRHAEADRFRVGVVMYVGHQIGCVLPEEDGIGDVRNVWSRDRQVVVADEIDQHRVGQRSCIRGIGIREGALVGVGRGVGRAVGAAGIAVDGRQAVVAVVLHDVAVGRLFLLREIVGNFGGAEARFGQLFFRFEGGAQRLERGLPLQQQASLHRLGRVRRCAFVGEPAARRPLAAVAGIFQAVGEAERRGILLALLRHDGVGRQAGIGDQAVGLYGVRGAFEFERGADRDARRGDRVGHATSHGPFLARERGGEGAFAARQVVGEADDELGSRGQRLRDHHEGVFAADDRAAGFRVDVVVVRVGQLGRALQREGAHAARRGPRVAADRVRAAAVDPFEGDGGHLAAEHLIARLERDGGQGVAEGEPHGTAARARIVRARRHDVELLLGRVGHRVDDAGQAARAAGGFVAQGPAEACVVRVGGVGVEAQVARTRVQDLRTVGRIPRTLFGRPRHFDVVGDGVRPQVFGLRPFGEGAAVADGREAERVVERLRGADLRAAGRRPVGRLRFRDLRDEVERFGRTLRLRHPFDGELPDRAVRRAVAVDPCLGHRDVEGETVRRGVRIVEGIGGAGDGSQCCAKGQRSPRRAENKTVVV